VSQLLLGVHRDHRLAGADVLADLPGQVGELGVAVLVLAALGDLGVALQAEPHGSQHPGHGPLREMPQGWLSADDEILEAALTQARAALREEATLVRRLSAYYRSDGDYAGSTFLDLNPALQRSA